MLLRTHCYVSREAMVYFSGSNVMLLRKHCYVAREAMYVAGKHYYVAREALVY